MKLNMPKSKIIIKSPKDHTRRLILDMIKGVKIGNDKLGYIILLYYHFAVFELITIWIMKHNAKQKQRQHDIIKGIVERRYYPIGSKTKSKQMK